MVLTAKIQRESIYYHKKLPSTNWDRMYQFSFCLHSDPEFTPLFPIFPPSSGRNLAEKKESQILTSVTLWSSEWRIRESNADDFVSIMTSLIVNIRDRHDPWPLNCRRICMFILSIEFQSEKCELYKIFLKFYNTFLKQRTHLRNMKFFILKNYQLWKQ